MKPIIYLPEQFHKAAAETLKALTNKHGKSAVMVGVFMENALTIYRSLAKQNIPDQLLKLVEHQFIAMLHELVVAYETPQHSVLAVVQALEEISQHISEELSGQKNLPDDNQAVKDAATAAQDAINKAKG